MKFIPQAPRATGLSWVSQAPSAATPMPWTVRKAQLGSIAQIQRMVAENDLISGYEQLYQANKRMLDSMSEREYNRRIADVSFQERAAEATRLSMQAPELTPYFSEQLNKPDEAMVVEDAVENMQFIREMTRTPEEQFYDELAANLDPNGGPFEQWARIMESRQLVLGALEQTSAERQLRRQYILDYVPGLGGIQSTGTDIVNMLLWPLISQANKTGNVPIPEEDKNWYDWLFSGERQARERYNLTLSPERTQEAIDTITRTNRDFFYGSNLVRRSENLIELLPENTPTAFEANVFDTFDLFVVGDVGDIAKAAGIAKTVSVINRFNPYNVLDTLRAGAGTRPAATATTEIVDRMATEGERAVEQTTGITIDNVAEIGLPAAVNPEGGLGQPAVMAANNAVNAETVLNQVWKDRQAIERLQGDEVIAAQEAAIESLPKRIRGRLVQDNVRNISVLDATPNSGFETRQVSVLIGKADGSLFSSAQTARKGAIDLGLDPVNITSIAGLPRPKSAAVLKTSFTIDPDLADDYLVNPSIDQFKEYSRSNLGQVSVLKTDDGNFIAYNNRSTSHAQAADELGLNYDSVGRGRLEKLTDLDSIKSLDDLRYVNSQDTPYNPASATLPQEVRDRLNTLQAEYESLKEGAARLREQGMLEPARKFNEEARRVAKEIKSLQAKPSKEAPSDQGAATVAYDPTENGWAIIYNIPVAEKGFFTPFQDNRTMFNIGRWVLGNREILPEDLAGLDILSNDRKRQVMVALKSVIEPAFRRLSTRELKNLNQITIRGMKERVWYDDNTFKMLYQSIANVQPKPKVLNAYHMFKLTNDMEWSIRNYAMVSELNARGMKTVDFTMPDGTIASTNARPVWDYTSNDFGDRVYDLTTGQHLLDGVTDPDTYKQKGYIAFKLDRAMQLDDGTHVRYIIAKPSSVTIKDLNPNQLNYSPGGHREYNGRVRKFVKQAKEITQPDTGESRYVQPMTLIGGQFESDVAPWAQAMNDALFHYRRYRRGSLKPETAKRRIAKVFSGRPGKYPSAEDFFNDLEDGTLDYRHNFEVVDDRQLPSVYNNPGASPRAFSLVEEDVPGSVSYSETYGRMYYSRKGSDVLTDYAGNDLPLIDAYGTINRAIANVSRIAGFSGYKERAIQKWVATYKDYLDVDPTLPDTIKFKAPFKKAQGNLQQQTINAADQQRAGIKRLLNWQTEEDRFFEQLKDNLLDSLDRLGLKRTAGAVYDITSSDWVARVNGAVVDIKLGLFNIAQLPLQMTTMAAAASIDPEMGLKAIPAAFMGRFFIIGDDVSQESFVKWWNVAFGEAGDTTVAGAGWTGPRPQGFKDELPRGTEPFFDKRLSADNNKMVEMARNGYSNAEIAEELQISPETLTVRLSNLRKKYPSFDIPKGVIGREPVRKSQIIELYKKGLDNQQIAARAGVTVNNVKVVLSKARKTGEIPPISKSGFGLPSIFDSGEEAYEAFMLLKHSGRLEVKHSMSVESNFRDQQDVNIGQGKVSRAVEAGRFFFHEAERWNRLYGFLMAWGRIKQRYGKDFDISNIKIRAELFDRADVLAGNMNEGRRAAWQKGLFSIPTKFWAYPMRMAELMTGRSLNRQEKMGLIIGQTALWGSAGIPLTNFITEQLQVWGGEPWEENSPQAIADRGLADLMFRMVSDGEVDITFGERVGTGTFFTDIVREFFNVSRYGDTSVSAFVGGAPGTVLADIFKDFGELIDYGTSEAGNGKLLGPITREEVLDLARNISSVNNSYKAYMAMRYDTLLSMNDTPITTDISSGEQLAIAFGISPSDFRDISIRMRWLQNQTDTAREVATQIANYRYMYAHAPDDAERARIREQMTFFTSYLVDPIILDQALDIVDMSSLDTLAESVERRATIRRNQQALVEALGEETLKEGAE